MLPTAPGPMTTMSMAFAFATMPVPGENFNLQIYSSGA